MEKCYLNQTGQSIKSQILSLAVITDNLQVSNIIYYNSLKIFQWHNKYS